MSFWELVIFVLGLACPRTGILPFFDHLSMWLDSSVDRFSYIYIHIYIHYHRVYYELTIDHLSMWLDSLVDRALHRYRKVMGSNPVQA